MSDPPVTPLFDLIYNAAADEGSILHDDTVMAIEQAVEARLATLQGKADAHDMVSLRLQDAHDYCHKYLMPHAWGRQVWHAILDDAVALRAQLARVEADWKKAEASVETYVTAYKQTIRERDDAWADLAALRGQTPKTV